MSNLAQLLTWRIQVQSESGSGSTFTTKLPIKFSKIVMESSVSISDEPPASKKSEYLNLLQSHSGKALT